MVLKPGLGAADHLAHLAGRDGFKGMTSLHVSARLDFDKDKAITMAAHQVDLTKRATPIALEDLDAGLLEMFRGQVFAVVAEGISQWTMRELRSRSDDGFRLGGSGHTGLILKAHDLLESRALATAVAHVVKLRPADAALLADFNLVDAG